MSGAKVRQAKFDYVRKCFGFDLQINFNFHGKQCTVVFVIFMV